MKFLLYLVASAINFAANLIELCLIIPGLSLLGSLDLGSCFSVVATIKSVVLPPISRAVYKKDKHEGDFRYAHSRIRDYAESMTFFDSSGVEKQNANSIFKGLINNEA